MSLHQSGEHSSSLTMVIESINSQQPTPSPRSTKYTTSSPSPSTKHASPPSPSPSITIEYTPTSLDERLSYEIFAYTQSSPLIHTLAEILSLSGDELLWFIAPAIVGSSIYAHRIFSGLIVLLSSTSSTPFPPPLKCAEETIWSIFGSVSSAVFLESILKTIFQRPRPSYSPSNKHYTVYGESMPSERFSLPSGHSLRVFYLLFWFRSDFVTLYTGDAAVAVDYESHLIVWAVLVALSRVAKAKHYLLDVVIGAAVGASFGYFMEVYLNQQQSSILKVVGGVYITFFFGIKTVFASSNLKYTLCFFVFFSSLFLSTLPESYEEFGKQTLARDEMGGVVCDSFF